MREASLPEDGKMIVRKLKHIGIVVVAVLVAIMLIITTGIATITAAVAGGADRDSKLGAAALYGLPEVITEDIVRAAVKAYEKYGVPTAITLAQIILESGTTFSELAEKDHNLFGVKYYGSGREGVHYRWYETTEYGSHGSYKVMAKFKIYSSYGEAIDEHGELLSQPMYKNKVKDLESSDSWADALQGVYATAPDYAAQLKAIMSEYNLYRFDHVTLSGLDDVFNIEFVGAESNANATQKKIATVASTYGDPYHNGWGKLCEAWVADVYRRAGLNYTGSCCASMARARFARGGGEVPVGAVIYSGDSYSSSVTCSVCGRNAGHVAIYIGNGKVAGSQVPYIMSINQWISVFGYGGYSFNNNSVL